MYEMQSAYMMYAKKESMYASWFKFGNYPVSIRGSLVFLICLSYGHSKINYCKSFLFDVASKVQKIRNS